SSSPACKSTRANSRARRGSLRAAPTGTLAMTTGLDNLLDLHQSALKAYCERVGEKSCPATQLFRCIHHRGVGNFDDMTDLARSLRAKLAGVAEVRPLSTITDKTSADGTRKWLLDVGQATAVETVYIPEDDPATLCISSQAGCAVGCRFCSTGHQGFSRNLTTGEIIAQLWHAEHQMRAKLGLGAGERAISNVVMM